MKTESQGPTTYSPPASLKTFLFKTRLIETVKAEMILDFLKAAALYRRDCD